jgi:hypothetical protein
MRKMSNVKFFIEKFNFIRALKNPQAGTKKPGFCIVFQAKEIFLNRLFNGRCACLGVEMDHNTTVNYSTTIPKAGYKANTF